MFSTDPKVLGIVARELVGSAFAKPSRWVHAVVIVRADEQRITSRGDFAHYLAANDLGAAARECRSRRVPLGCVLVWLEVDAPNVAAAGFVVCDVATAMAQRAA
jgi:hypothetical protein